MSAIEGRALRVSAGTQSGCSKSCSHDYYLRYLQPSVYRAPFYGPILQRALSANVTPSQPYARDESQPYAQDE